jgi:DME family drug/metabolite transporter
VSARDARTLRLTDGTWFILLAALLWGMFGPVARVALRDGVAPLEIAFWRTVIAGALFAAHVALVRLRRSAARGTARAPLSIARADLPALLLFALTAVAALYAFLPLAVEAGGATLAVVLLYTAPAWVALFAWLAFGERLTPRTVLAVALTLVGIVGIAFSGEQAVRPTSAALGWGLAAGLSYASLYLFGKRLFSRYPPAVVFLHALPIATVVLFPLADFAHKSPVAWAALLVLGVVCTYAAYLAYSTGLARIEATRAATIATTEPVIAALLAFVFWDERLPAIGYLAAALVLSGVILTASAPGVAASRES